MGKKRELRTTLDGVLNGAWAMLKRGADRFNDPFHWPVLGTVGENDSRLRTVILRHFLLPERALICYTDARAAKVRDIMNINTVSWLFYHPKKKIQLRISGHATCHGDDQVAEKHWAKTRITNRINYASIEPPGVSVDKPMSGLPGFFTRLPTLLESEKGRKNFMVIISRIDSMDWLILSPLGNRRARFDWDGDRMKANWLIP
ncbi:MAG: pyridoxamine 5'-phosphate oxidase family protein [Deltaproteobacteria bacterium]|nr:pyridoxamine 5'-phosphate oxidase family protein [Deltaproteobacteria bacterium]